MKPRNGSIISSISTTSLPTIPENSNFSENSNARIRVVVRVRPLTSKELSQGEKIIVQDVGNDNKSLAVWDPAALHLSQAMEKSNVDPSAWTKPFQFDRIFWSLDTLDPNYASQAILFEELGQPVIDWVMNGYNCSVLAYGQTGGGKTFTMSNMTNQRNPNEFGLIPRICFALFEVLNEQMTGGGGGDNSNYSDIYYNNSNNNSGMNKDISVTLSHMEIYNDAVRDLLAPPTQGFLKVREHPQQGVFVPNLTTVKVTSFEDVMSLVAIGDRNRTVAATQMNANSSRSHSIVNIIVTQRSRNSPRNGIPTSALQQKVSKVYLVDLAGSERVAFSGAKGERLKEANHINVSLSVLGDVIKNLGESSKKNNSEKSSNFIPYRNSTLTMILKESLGGNAYTIMLSCISPSSHDYEETLSTLKYADRAKKVKLKVKANITSGLLATDSSALALVPLLQAEVRKLREMLAQQQKQQEEQQKLLLLASQHMNSPPNSSASSSSSSNMMISNENRNATKRTSQRSRPEYDEYDGAYEIYQYMENNSRNTRRLTSSNMIQPEVITTSQIQRQDYTTTSNSNSSNNRRGASSSNNNTTTTNNNTVVSVDSQTTVMLSMMQERVRELEEQLLEREELIANLASAGGGGGGSAAGREVLTPTINTSPKQFSTTHNNNGVMNVEVVNNMSRTADRQSQGSTHQYQSNNRDYDISGNNRMTNTDRYENIVEEYPPELYTIEKDIITDINNHDNYTNIIDDDGVEQNDDEEAVVVDINPIVKIRKSIGKSINQSLQVSTLHSTSHDHKLLIQSKSIPSSPSRQIQSQQSQSQQSQLQSDNGINRLEYSHDSNNGNSGNSGSNSSNMHVPISSSSSSSLQESPSSILRKSVMMLADEAIETNMPRLINLNQDPLFSEVLVYYITQGSLLAGTQIVNADILLSGPDIIDRHCIISIYDTQVWIRPYPGAIVFLNGELLAVPPSPTYSPVRRNSKNKSHIQMSSEILDLFWDDPVYAYDNSKKCLPYGYKVYHYDRIAFGRFHLFRFEDNSNNTRIGAKTSTNKDGNTDNLKLNTVVPGWDYAHEELVSKNKTMMTSSINTKAQYLLQETEINKSSINSMNLSSKQVEEAFSMKNMISPTGSNRNRVLSDDSSTGRQGDRTIINHDIMNPVTATSTTTTNNSNTSSSNGRSKSQGYIEETAEDRIVIVNGKYVDSDRRRNGDNKNRQIVDSNIRPTTTVTSSSSSSSSSSSAVVSSYSSSSLKLFPMINDNPHDVDDDDHYRREDIPVQTQNATKMQAQVVRHKISSKSKSNGENVSVMGDITTEKDMNDKEDRRRERRNENDRTRSTTTNNSNTITSTNTSNSTTNASGTNGKISYDSFEEEARALQQELAMMQQTLQDRMNKYHHLTNSL